MPKGVFITGGSGFVGHRLLEAAPALGRPVFALLRGARAARASETPDVSIVSGDSAPPRVLPGRPAILLDTVMHLAAATGRASAADHERVNAKGTEILLEECRRAGVAKVLFVSSVATTFPGKTGYHYALTKAHAEEAVRRSGLRFLILRPTMILWAGRTRPHCAREAGDVTCRRTTRRRPRSCSAHPC